MIIFRFPSEHVQITQNTMTVLWQIKSCKRCNQRMLLIIVVVKFIMLAISEMMYIFIINIHSPNNSFNLQKQNMLEKINLVVTPLRWRIIPCCQCHFVPVIILRILLKQWLFILFCFVYREKEMEDRKRKEKVGIKLCVVFWNTLSIQIILKKGGVRGLQFVQKRGSKKSMFFSHDIILFSEKSVNLNPAVPFSF